MGLSPNRLDDKIIGAPAKTLFCLGLSQSKGLMAEKSTRDESLWIVVTVRLTKESVRDR